MRGLTSILSVAIASAAVAGGDADQDGLPDGGDACPVVTYTPGFDWSVCPPIDGNPANNIHPECMARERVAATLGGYNHVAFSIVKDGQLHFADAFRNDGGVVHDPDAIHRLYRIGSTSKPVTAAAAVVLQEEGVLSFDDFVSDDDGTQVLVGGQVTLGNLLSHRGAFSLDSGALHLFCYPGTLAEFWAEPDDGVSPHYDSATWGNLGGGYDYSAFNFALAAAYMEHKSGEPYGQLVQTRVFDRTGMCTATTDASLAASSPIGSEVWGVAAGASGQVGPYINLVSQSDPRCEDNYYSSDDLPEDPFTWLPYRLDEAAADVRDPAGGVIATVLDMAHFAEALLAANQGADDWISPAGLGQLWYATSDLSGHPHSFYHAYYATGFMTDTITAPYTQVGHAGGRAGYASAFVLRPEAGLAISILIDNLPASAAENLAKTILDDFESHCPADLDGGGVVDVTDFLTLLASWGTAGPGAAIAPPYDTTDVSDFLGLLAAWGPCP